MAQLAVLIPARQYEPTLMPLVDALLNAGFGAVIVVDDGSSAEDQPFFAALAGKHGVYLAHHTVNLGKGRALKTGICCYLNTFPVFYGLITADADGQHTVQDIVRVGEALLAHPRCAVLGVRSFTGNVPLRSRFGNALSSLIFRIASRKAVKDTQSGLRGFPSSLLVELEALDGERYEYETAVLMYLCRHGHVPMQIPISTIYINGNRSSHFDLVRDSMRIGFVLLRYSRLS